MKFIKSTMAAVPILALLFATAPAQAVNIAVNGGFETGDFTGWTQFISGTQSVVTTNPSTGIYAANLNNTVLASSSGIKNANIGIGLVAPNTPITVTLDARGTVANGGVAFAELFSELSGGGVSKAEILGGAPLALDPDPNTWKTFVFNTTTGPDVSGGVTLQLTAITGGAPGSVANIFYDNVSVEVIPIPAAAWLFGSALGLLGWLRRRAQ